jgi:hypothetical protein
MNIEGRVAQILEPRTGKRQDGTEWKTLPFIVEYFEHETDMTPQSVMLETFDTNVIDNIKVDMTVRCVISMKAEHWTKENREGWLQKVRLHNITCLAMPKKRKAFMPQENQYAAAAANMAEQHDQTAAKANVPTTEPEAEDPDELPF